MYQHPVFVRKVGGGKVIVLTILPEEAFPLNEEDNDVFFLATTDKNIYTGVDNPNISIIANSKCSSEEYTKISGNESTIGDSITGIIKSPFWFIKKVKSVMNMMGM